MRGRQSPNESLCGSSEMKLAIGQCAQIALGRFFVSDQFDRGTATSEVAQDFRRSQAPLLLVFGEDRVGITVQPAFSGLSRGDDRMPAGAGVFAGVLIGRAVATERRAAFLARPQMDPDGADLHAFLALAAFGLFGRSDPVDV
jgi:hypothetical protein